MEKVLTVVLLMVVPVVVAAVGVRLWIRRLNAVGLRFNYSLLDCLAAMVIFLPTSGVAALYSVIGSARGATLGVTGMLTTLVSAQVFGLVMGRASALMNGKEGVRSLVWVLLAGFLGILLAVLYLTACILLLAMATSR